MKKSIIITVVIFLGVISLQSYALRELNGDEVNYSQCLSKYRDIQDHYSYAGIHPACLVVDWNEQCKTKFVDVESGYDNSPHEAFNLYCFNAVIVLGEPTRLTMINRDNIAKN